LKEELQEFAELLRRHPRIWVMSDDTYYALVYEPHVWTSILQIAPDLRSRSCVIGSLSKSYAMTGWRLGWAAGPKTLIDSIIKVQGQVSSGPSSISQAAGVAALTSEHHYAADFRARYAARRQLVLKALRSIPGLKVPEPEGAFYSFFDLSARVPADAVTRFCSELLEKHGVCLIPGEAFGEPGCVRLTYSLSEPEILEGVERIRKALDEIG
jgi:aspartate aminotransferase